MDRTTRRPDDLRRPDAAPAAPEQDAPDTVAELAATEGLSSLILDCCIEAARKAQEENAKLVPPPRQE